MNPHTEALPAPSPVWRFREPPPAVTQVLAAARRIDPALGLFVTCAPGTGGADWEFHPFRRWLILRDLNEGILVDAVACALLARTADLGKGALTEIPPPLRSRHRQVLDALESAIGNRASGSASA
jgi:hypothetical protein